MPRADSAESEDEVAVSERKDKEEERPRLQMIAQWRRLARPEGGRGNHRPPQQVDDASKSEQQPTRRPLQVRWSIVLIQFKMGENWTLFSFRPEASTQTAELVLMQCCILSVKSMTQCKCLLSLQFYSLMKEYLDDFVLM